MAHSKTYIDPSLPLSLARVARVTGNPMLDVGFQCLGERPYFRFPGAGYTTLHPDRCTAPTEVTVYSFAYAFPSGDKALTVLGRGTQDGGSLSFGSATGQWDGSFETFRSGEVNRWAKCKPIRQPKTGDLSDAERRGSLADRNDGFWYGVRIAAPAGSYALIHDADFEYRRPRGPEYGEPFRLSDFSGYDADATPGLSGSVASDALYRDVETPVPALIDLVRSGTTGIDFADAVTASMGAGSPEDAFADLFPMALVDGWAAAMTNSELGTVTPLFSGGVWHRAFGFNLKALDDAMPGGLALGVHRLSLFLVPDDPLLDLSGAWQDVESSVGSRQAFAVPYASGLAAEVKEMYPAAPQVTFGVAATDTSLLVLISHGAITRDMTVRVTVRVTGGSSAATKTVTRRPDAAVSVPAVFSWLDDLGIRVTPGMQQQIAVTVSGASWYVEGHETAAQTLRTTVTVGD